MINQKRLIILAITFVIFMIAISSISVSAFSLGDFSDFFKNFWGKITGRATENNPPSATLYAKPLSGEAPLTVSFTISCSDPDTDPGNYLAICSLEYGDNSVAPYVSEAGKPVSKTTQHTYSSAGTYTVVIKAIDYKMLETKKEITIVVTKASATPTPTPSPSPSPSPSASPSPTASPTPTPTIQALCSGPLKPNFLKKETCTDKSGKYSDYCSSTTQLTEYYCKNNNCTKSIKNCSESNMICNKSAGVCVESQVEELEGYLQVATIKDTYNIGEKVELTDPPEKTSSSNNIQLTSSQKSYISGDVIIDNTPSEDIRSRSQVLDRYSTAENPIYDNDLVTSNYNSQIRLTDLRDKTLEENQSLRFNGYIIQFEDKSILEKKHELEEDAKKNKEYVEKAFVLNPVRVYKQLFSIMPEDVDKKIEKYSRDLEESNKGIKEKIKSKISERRAKITGWAISDSELEFRNEFTTVFNGVSLYVSEAEAEEIKKISGVKEVYPNLIVHTTLMDSVPLINADDVWQLDKDGNNCAETGQECLTGKGVTIAIIDTGIDYTHPDLGGCDKFEEYYSPAYDKEEYCFDPFSINLNGCAEDDGGINYCHFGRIWDGSSGTWDACRGKFLSEKYCLENGNSDEIIIECPDSCKRGACVKENKLNCSKVVGGYDFVECDEFSITGYCLAGRESDPDPMDDQGHGTHCAGIVAGNGTLKGVAPDAKLYAYKVLNKAGQGLSSWVIAGIERAVKDKADIISMSLGAYCMGSYSNHCGPDDPLSQVVDNAVSSGVVVVVAAGNDGPWTRTIGSPGTARKALTVGAAYKKDYESFWIECKPNEDTSCGLCEKDGRVLCSYWDDNPRTGQLTSFSSRGPVHPLYTYNDQEKLIKYENGIIKPDIIAPGALICSTKLPEFEPWDSNIYYQKCLDDKHVLLAGTSMATPMVAGAVALIKQKNPDWTPEEIKMALKISSTDMGLSNKEQGAGMLDILGATNLIAKKEYPEFGILSPLDRDFIFDSHTPINITGIFPKDYDELTVKYSIDPNSDSWMDEGISVIGKNNLIAEFNPRSLIKSGLYRFKVFIKKGDFSESDFVDLYFDINLRGMSKDKMEGWIFGYSIKSIYSPPIIEDIDGNGNKEIILSGIDELYDVMQSYDTGRIYIADSNLEPLSGWFFGQPIGKFTGFPESAVSVGDLNNDGKIEIVVGSSSIEDRDTFKNNGGLYIFNYSGSLLWKRLEGLGYFTGSTLSDIIGDENKEIIVSVEVSRNWKSPDNNKLVIYGLDHEGRELFKTRIGSSQRQVGFTRVLSPALYDRVKTSVGDVNGDGNKEIILLAYNYDWDKTLYVIDNKGNEIFSLNLKTILKNESMRTDEIVLADINNDNIQEIVFVSEPYSFYESSYLIYLSYNKTTYEPYLIPLEFHADDVIPGDINSDGITELVLNGYYYSNHKLDGIVAVINLSGNILFKKNFENIHYISLPVVANINRDKEQEIIFAVSKYRSIERVYALNSNGDLLNDFPKLILDNINPESLAVDDLDNNGLAEIIGFSSSEYASRVFYVWEMKEFYDKFENEWPQFQHDPQHTGCYDCKETQPKTFIKSMINNTGKTIISGRLLMKAQKQVNGIWQDIKIVVNKTVSVEGSKYLALDKEWQAAGFFTPAEAGTYRVYAALLDNNNNVVATAESKLEATYEFKVI